MPTLTAEQAHKEHPERCLAEFEIAGGCAHLVCTAMDHSHLPPLTSCDCNA